MSESPLVSVVVIAKKREDLADIQLHLSRQRFRNFEVVFGVGGSIPEAWNRAIRKTRGRYIVFTETDVRPLSEHWLEELVHEMVEHDDGLVKGLEVVGTPWNLCNTIIKREIFEKLAFDETFCWAEDTELFSRMTQLGYSVRRVERAAVFHSFDPHTSQALRRAFAYGMNWMRIRHRYTKPIEVALIRDWARRCLISFLQLLGLLAGYVRYTGERRFRATPETVSQSLLTPDSPSPVREMTVHSMAERRPRSRKVLYVSPLPPTRSGIASYGQAYSDAWEAYAKDWDIVRFPETVRRPCAPNDLADEVRRLHERLRQESFDVVHVETGYGLLREFFMLLSLPKERPYKIVVTVHDAPCLAGEPLRFLGDAHALIDEVPGVMGPATIRSHSFELEKVGYHAADLLFVLSQTGARVLKHQFGERPGVNMLPHGVDIPGDRSHQPRSGPLRLLCFGFLHPGKGVDIVLEALRLLPRDLAVLTIVGEPYCLTSEGTTANEHYRQKIVETIRNNDLVGRVEIQGYVEEEDVDQVFEQADVLVVADRESGIASVSGVLLRGMAHGLAVICTAVRSFQELVDDGVTGRVVVPDSPKALAEVIQIFGENRVESIELGRRARLMMKEHHEWKYVIHDAERAFDRLVNSDEKYVQRVANS